MFTKQEQEYLLRLAHEAIEHYLGTGKELIVGKANISSFLQENRACFVTLTLNKELRGCIGHLQAIQPLYKDVVENAMGAAFQDPRFPPLKHDELDNIEIEVSVLSEARQLSYQNREELVQGLRPQIDGVIIEKGECGATYLPQVWEELSSPEEFLSSLCLKAGLPENEWTKGDLRVSTYTVEIIK